nr:carboxylic acid reductase [Mycobacterium colombiense]
MDDAQRSLSRPEVGGVAQDPDEVLRSRIAELCDEDPEVNRSRPSPSVDAALRRPRLKLAEIVQTAMEGYADRPAVGQRRREFVTDPATSRTSTRLLPEFETMSYRQLWSRVRAVATEWRGHERHPLSPGDFVCILGFASIDYATVDLACLCSGAVVVPLQAGAPAAQHRLIMTETNPLILAAALEYLDAAVEAVLAGTAPQRLMVLDYEPRDPDAKTRLDDARSRLADAGVRVDTLDDVIAAESSAPSVPLHIPAADDDPVLALIYTSGSTGTPKGAMYTDSMLNRTWLRPSQAPVINVNYLPMSHMYGRGTLAYALANGGTCHFAAKSDMSTLFDDIRLVRPTELSLVPRVVELMYQHFLRQRDRLLSAENPSDDVEQDLKREIRNSDFGGRVLSANTASAPLAPELRSFVETCLGVRLHTTYGSTEMGGVLVDNMINRANVIDYKLVDVPELGYFTTDKPFPRGELLIKTRTMTPGYYRRPEATASTFDEDGFYRSGDVMALVGPDELRYLDRRNNVMKLSQGEFVAVAQLENAFTTSPLIHQMFIYGSSAEAFLLAVVVPDRDVIARIDSLGMAQIKRLIAESLHQIAAQRHLNGYEVPRDFLIETEPFSVENGLLTGAAKMARPQLNRRYGPRLDDLYAQLRAAQASELQALRADARQAPVLDTVLRAAAASIGLSRSGVGRDSKFTDLGGDSLSALNFSQLLEEVLDVTVPVGVVIDPTADLERVARYIEAQRTPEANTRPNFTAVHGRDAAEIQACDLMLDKFIDIQTLTDATRLRKPSTAIQSVLLTGVTGFLGRFVCLNWMQRLADTGGKVVCLVRGADAIEARRRIDEAVGTDPALRERFQTLADDHLEVLVGDLGSPNVGLSQAEWDRLAGEIDLIVHPGAHVNHMLPYSQLFTANVVGTADLIKLAMTAKLKTFHYVSSIGAALTEDGTVDEDADMRTACPKRSMITNEYAGGYAASKWAAEVLMREAHDLCGLPVVVFRPDMIMADSRYVGQINSPDLITRLLFSLIVSGIAPRSFYRGQHCGQVRPHFDGLPVDFVAKVVSEVGAQCTTGYHTYNIVNPHDDGVSLNDFVDWLIAAGNPIVCVDDYDAWLSRFEIALRGLPDKQRHQSVLALLDVYRHPLEPTHGSAAPCTRLEQAVRAMGAEIPHLSAELIEKYSAGLRLMGLV